MVALVTMVWRELPCVVNLDNMTTTPRAYLFELITRLGPDRMGDVCQALAVATGC